MYDLSNQIGRYAARTRFVELYNDVNGGEVTDDDYFGVYSLMDRIEADPNRVDIARIQPWENSEPEVTGGYIFKQDWNDPANTTIYNVPNSGDLLVPSDPDGDTVTAAQESYIEQYLSEMTVALRNAPSGINPYSLVLIAPATNPDHTVASNWRSSVARGGSSGDSDATTFAEWSADRGGVSAGSDDDHDGRDGLTEYIVAGDPDVPDATGSQFTISTMLFELGGVEVEYVAFSVRKNLAADDVEMIPQTSTDLLNWIDARADLVFVEEINHGDGSANLLYRSALPLSQLPSNPFWYRLRRILRSN